MSRIDRACHREMSRIDRASHRGVSLIQIMLDQTCRVFPRDQTCRVSREGILNRPIGPKSKDTQAHILLRATDKDLMGEIRKALLPIRIGMDRTETPDEDMRIQIPPE
jgi:hypothetical protein